MTNLWTIIIEIFTKIMDFLNWLINDTPLIEDTTKSIYKMIIDFGSDFKPLVAEWIQYLSEYPPV